MSDETQQIINNAGEGKCSAVPVEIAKEFNWGAFLLNWIWGLGNKTYITLLIFAASILSLIPFIGFLIPLGCSIWFGIKGNEWAWQNKKWDSVEHFTSVQKTWAKIGVILIIAGFVIGIIFGILAVFLGIMVGMSK